MTNSNGLFDQAFASLFTPQETPLSAYSKQEQPKSILDRLLTETWPARAATGILDALMLPGQVAGGALNVQPTTPGQWSDVDEARRQATYGTMANRATDLAGLIMGGTYGAAPAGAVGMSGAKLPSRVTHADELVDLLTSRGYKTSDPVTAYTGSSYLDIYKTDPSGMRTQGRIRVSDHPPGKNYDARNDFNFDVSQPQRSADRLVSYLDSIETGLMRSVARRQEAERLYDAMGYKAANPNDRNNVLRQIHEALDTGKPTRRMQEYYNSGGR